MPDESEDRAIVLTDDLFADPHAKTAHGLVRGPSRYEVAAVVDRMHGGRDAGEVLDGRRRGIPIVGSVEEALDAPGARPTVCVVGVATEGGVLPDGMRGQLLRCADAGMTLVNGLHQLLGDDEGLAARVRRAGGRIVDIRRPRPVRELAFWSGRILELETPRVAVLGTDCALGKRTTCSWLTDALIERGVRAEMVYTGQTGWLQGRRHGFVFDATPNDFVTGELERAVLGCAAETRAEVILLEGQSALRNPAGPCGAEFIVSAGAAGVVLQHAPARRCFEGLEERGCEIPPVTDEVELIRRLGADVWAVTLHEEGLDAARAEEVRAELERALDLPVVLPLRDGVGRVADVLMERLGR